MKKWVKPACLVLGTTALAALSSYVTTNLMIALALDREKPKIFEKAPNILAGSEAPTEFVNAAVECAKKLAETEHEVITITSHDGIELVGHWFGRSNAKRVMIGMHGWRSAWNVDFGMVSDIWFANDCSALIVEQRGQNASGGDHMGFGLIERFDCLDWIEWVTERVGDKLPIYLCGVSMGASTVLMATGLDLPENVHGVMADCGFTSPHEIWRHVAQDNLHIGFGLRGAIATELTKRRINMEDNYSTVDALRSCTVPVIFFHGSDDHFVPVEMTYENYKACAAPKRLLIVPGADHGMSLYVERDRYVQAAEEFWRDFD